MLTDPKFLERMKGSVSVVSKYDIPYVAGYSKDGKHIYIDRHMNTKMNDKDITKYLVVHEKTEKVLLQLFNLKYQQAHHIATAVEHAAVVKDGIDWNVYSKYVDKFVKTLGHENLSNAPPDLDLTPYKDEKDYHVFLRKYKNEL
jgi:hypothetical protein